MSKIEAMQNKRSNLLLIILFLQFMALVLTFFDVPIARQVVVFFFFTFIPGFVFLKLLRLNELSILETVLFSSGLSLAFLMLAGLLINELGLLLGLLKPLSFFYLVVVLNILVLISIILVWLRDKNTFLFKAEMSGFSPMFLVAILPLVLSMVGAMWVNAYGNNVFLMFMLVMISLIFTVFVFAEKWTLSRFYPFFVFVMALSLLYHSSLISGYVYTGDVHMEYFVARTTLDEEFWFSANPYPGDMVYGKLYSMASISILPAIYANLLNMDLTWVFKLLFPFIFAFVPLGLYRLWEKYFGKGYAFVSAFFFMAFEVFYTEMLGLNRQMVAELFFVLLLLLIFNNNIKKHVMAVCFAIFSFGLVASHYGLAEVVLFFVLFTFVSLILIRQRSKNITFTLVLLFFTIMFAWYIFTSESAVFDSILYYGEYVRSRLVDFFNPMSRDPFILRGLGLEVPPTFWNAVSRAFAYTTEGLIVAGFVGLITKKVRFRFDKEYFVLNVLAIGFLGTLIAVPGLADTMNMTRFYHILLFFLAPLCVVGAKFFVDLILKRKRELAVSILLLTVLVPYFLFQTGFVFELVKSRSYSVPLSKYRMDNIYLMVTFAYVNGWKASTAQWLYNHIEVENTLVYSDYSAHELGNYGMMRTAQHAVLSNTTQLSASEVVYLSYLNIVDGIIVTRRYTFNSTTLSFVYNANVAYSNGGGYIYKIPDG